MLFRSRIAKTLLVAGVALYLILVVVNNFSDYGSNFIVVQHVMSMDTTFPGNSGMWRSVHSSWLFHAYYVALIAWELIAASLLLRGALQLWQARDQPATSFNNAKRFAVAGLVVNMLQWLVAFLAVGGEWFLMWQSRTWNVSDTAGRMFTILGIVLLFVSTPDAELTSPHLA